MLCHSPTSASCSATPFDDANAFQSLIERLDTICLDVQELHLDYQEDMRTLTSDFHAYQEAQDGCYQELMRH